MNKSILDAIHSLEPSYINEAIIVVGDNVVAEAEITWGGATPLNNADIQTEFDRLQALEDNCHEPRRNSYPSIQEQLDKLYHDMTAGKLDSTGEWHKTIKAIKDANPKG
tara:strand:- start:49 stop:375 length:327 start_codon:yes stop_codon:yes gene_type:complete